ncbi:MAG: hypothetical protein OEM23_06970 [Gemmatimonadota bacterium]|nr:hypothetical protein [Gemmatimonadota bacterium]
MRRSILTVLAVGTFLVAAHGLHAQEAAPEAAEAAEAASDVQVVGATFLNPGAMEPMALNAEFTGSGDDLTAALTVPGMDLRVELNELLITDDTFTFSFLEPGGTLTIECSLYKLDDASFRGECFAGDDTAEMTIEAFEQ